MTGSPTSIVLCAVLMASATLLGSCGDDGGTGGSTGTGGSPVSGNIVFTDSWKGEWNIVITFRQCVSQDTLEIEDITDVVCAGDTLDLQLSDLLDDCTGTITDTRVMVDCAYSFSDAGCDVDLAFTLELERQGNSLSGMGQWSATASGTCPAYVSGCEEFVISGTRIDTDPSECASPLPLNVSDRLGLRPRLFLRPYAR